MFKNILIPIVDDMVTPKIMKKISDLALTDGASITLAYISDPRAPFVYTRKASDYKISDANHKKACEHHAADLFLRASKLIDKGVKVKMTTNEVLGIGGTILSMSGLLLALVKTL